jgi:hypothetical protein
MKILIRTKDDLEKLRTQGISYAWRINKSRLNNLTEVEIYNFSGSEKVVGTFDPANSKVLNNGRVAVAFKNGKNEPCDFKWIGQYPIKYKSSDNQEAELTDDEKVDTEKELNMTEIERIAENLKNNFLFQASLGSKELFHSNMLAWILEQKNDNGEFEVLKLFVKNISGKNLPKLTDGEYPDFRIEREQQNIDLTIKWRSGNDWNLIFIENKMKSIPDIEQLKQYNSKIEKFLKYKTKLEIAEKSSISLTRVLIDKFILTPFKSEIETKANEIGWKNITYSEEIINFLKEIKDFEFDKSGETNIKMVIEKYISFLEVQNEILIYLNLDKSENLKNRYYDFYSKNMIQNDDEIDEIISIEDQDTKHYMSHVRSLRLHDLVLKLAHSNLSNLLYEAFQNHNLKEYHFHTNFTNSTGITSVRTRLFERKNEKEQSKNKFIDIGIQLQGNQFRHYLSSSSNIKEKNIEMATELFNKRIWFHDLITKKTLLGNGRSKFLKHIKDTNEQPRIFCEYNKGAFLYFYEDIYQDDKIPSIEEIIRKFIDTFKYYESKKTEIVRILNVIS